MEMGRQGDRLGDLMVTWRDLRRSPGHVIYGRLQQVLEGAGFAPFVEAACEPYYSQTWTRSQSRRAGISACTRGTISRAQILSKGWNGGIPIRCR